ncbi:MAG: hypothetical protein JWR75_2146 [Devosia sp.]|nr:hypothetical protein [Devosia sp.]
MSCQRHAIAPNQRRRAFGARVRLMENRFMIVRRHNSRLAAIAFSALLATAIPFAALAQDTTAPVAPAAEPAAPAADPAAPATEPAAAPDPTAVVATVGDVTITEQDLALVAEDFQEELAQVPPEDRRAFLLNVLIDLKVMAAAARADGLADTEDYQRRLGYLEDQVLRREYISTKISAQVTPEAVQAAYDSFASTFQASDEVQASHILVATEDEAKAVKAELEGGADFATVAKAKSIDPSAQQNGGDLGSFGPGMMVKPFEDAAFALTEIGQVSDPVQSDFGWHVIKLTGKSKSAAPTMEQLGPQLQQQVLVAAFTQAIKDLKSKTTVTIADPELAAAVAAQNPQ